MVKNQHYIPQFYLKRFGKNGKIDVYDIKNKKFIPNSNVSNFASKRFFYDIDTNKLDSELSILRKFIMSLMMILIIEEYLIIHNLLKKLYQK